MADAKEETTMRDACRTVTMPTALPVFALMLGVVVALGGPRAVRAADQEAARAIVVTGSGQVMAKPDRATLRAGVVTQATTAAAALGENGKKMQQVFAGLASFGIPAEDMQTSIFTVSPQYSRGKAAAAEAPHIVGYQVTNQLSLTVRDVNRVGELLDALVRLGANELYDVQFALSDPEPLLDQARLAAVKDAKRKAEIFSTAAGATLGRVLSMEEIGSQRPPPAFMARASVAESVPVASGQETLSVTVSVRYALE
jgi:uncharacterized protein YggE